MNLLFKKPTDKEFKKVLLLIEEYQLDNRNLKKEEFTIAVHKDNLVGFGRIRHHKDCLELCSVGILKSQRNNGIGHALISHIIAKSPSKPIYVVCIIPSFFKHFGFKNISTYPRSIEEKLSYCTEELRVPEKYVVMSKTTQ